jgi:hypothetical protein
VTTSIITLPGTALDVQRAVNRLALHVATLHHKLQKEYSRDWLEAELRKGLCDGRLSLCIKAVEAADKGDEIADAALRRVHAEMQGGMVVEREPGHLQVWAYGQRAIERPPRKRPRGHRWHDDWLRNLMICFLIDLACREYGVHPTRNREARRANREPSAISLVVAALARNKVHIDEASVQQNIWFGLPGELARAAADSWFAGSAYHK